MNFPIQTSVLQTEYLPNKKSKKATLQGNYSGLLYWKNKQERQNRKDQAWRRLATKNKIAQTIGYNLPTHQEKRNLTTLLKQYGEYSYLTGKKLGTYYLSTLDIDIRKEDFPERMIAYLEKNVKLLTNSLQVSYDKTKKGLHVDILTPELLPNEQIYFQGWKKTWNIGSIQSLGKYVVGEDKEKAFIKNGKWYWKVQTSQQIKTQLTKFFFQLGKSEQKTEKNQPNSFEYQEWNFSAKKWELKLGFWSEKYQKIIPVKQGLKKIIASSVIQRKRHTIRAKILSKQETNLEHLWKVFCLDQRTQKISYFLVNDYHRETEFNNLNIGSVLNMVLITGNKHRFFSRIVR